MATEAARTNFISRGFGFFRESWEELKKVHTPTKDETIRATVGVVLMVFFFGIFLGLTDFVIGTVLQRLMS